MSKLKTFIKLLKTPRKLIKPLGDNGFFNWLPDKPYLKLLFRAELEKKLDLNNPRTFNEKLQWIKLYDRKPEYSTYVDKYEVRNHISKIIGKECLIPLIGVYNTVEEIPWGTLPNQFVLKCTHGSGSNIICQDKQKLDIKKSEKKLSSWMKKNWYWFGREWPYKNIKPRIICEKYTTDESGVELKDYKIMCFNGEPKIIQVMSGREKSDYYVNHFDINWNRLEIPRKGVKESPKEIKKPSCLDKMINISKILSKDIPFSRIDLYSTKDGIYFGEITFFPTSGYMDFKKEETDYLLGSWIKLPSKI